MKRILKFFDAALRGILTCMVVAQAVILVLGVIWRYVLNNPIIWVDESIRYLLVWISFLGIGHVTKEHKHIAVTAIDSYLPAKIAKFLDILSDIIVLILLGIMIYFGVGVAAGQIKVRGETLAWFRFGYVYAAIPVGCFIGAVYLVRKLFLYTRGVHESEKEMS
jgi:TRAP-type C4-dicarboxylate transport system permease small subunit